MSERMEQSPLGQLHFALNEVFYNTELIKNKRGKYEAKLAGVIKDNDPRNPDELVYLKKYVDKENTGYVMSMRQGDIIIDTNSLTILAKEGSSTLSDEGTLRLAQIIHSSEWYQDLDKLKRSREKIGTAAILGGVGISAYGMVMQPLILEIENELLYYGGMTSLAASVAVAGALFSKFPKWHQVHAPKHLPEDKQIPPQ